MSRLLSDSWSLKSKIREYLARRLGAPEIPLALERLSNLGFKPNLIFDVGAYQGEFAQCCLHVWPQAKVSCFEALDHKVSQLQDLAVKHPTIQVFPGLLGAEFHEKCRCISPKRHPLF